MKKRKLKKWVKVVLIILGIALTIYILKEDAKIKRKINDCIKQGYSEKYCMYKNDIND